MRQTTITAVGNLTTAVDRRDVGGGRVVAHFRIACTERRWERTSGMWADGDTFHIGVSCWRDLADGVAATLAKGDPVIVRGRISTSTYDDKDGRRTSVPEIDADAVGPDLGRCRVTGLTRTRRGTGEPRGGRGAPGSAAPAVPVERDADAATGGGLPQAVPAGGC